MGSALRRATTNFNVENRAHRLIDKGKLPRSPLHPTTIKKMKELEKDTGKLPRSPLHPTTIKKMKELEKEGVSMTEAKSKLHQKDSRLVGMLQDVRVESTDPLPKTPDGSHSRRVLPQDRRPIPEPLSEVASQSMALVPPGRLSVYMVQELLAKNKLNPQEYNAERIAKDYTLDLKDTKNILEYFRTLKVVPLLSEEDVEKLKEQEQIEGHATGKLESGPYKS
ncbi:NADH dehydrogenase [ubiquinone] 1 alpha subcomplex assembly factor 4-like [Amphiura filiformis]|uniref:NADH dehydrogenase [ubiquinone] 1 alpha subcomplex assembly factor 4-like n=1 Tax=Amphiura filiformis TaxID=82378 RepID=UPI003B2266AD